MLYYIGCLFDNSPLRLFSSFVVLLSIGSLLSAAITWIVLPRLWKYLPHDHGKALVQGGMASKGKPTGAGVIIALCILPALLLVVPWGDSLGNIKQGSRVWLVVVALYAMMAAGYLDDRSSKPWGQLKKGMIDLACCMVCAWAMYCDGMNQIWVPLTKHVFTLSAYLYMPIATFILFIAVNSANCSDGVDGLAGSLGLLSLLSLAMLLYLVLGYKPVAEYLLLPHYPGGARWAVVMMTIAGGFASYLWYNAEPSQVLMGDAGSRMLGLAIGVAVLAAGNPLLIFVFAPVIFLDGGTGLVKLTLFRLFKHLGFDITPQANGAAQANVSRPQRTCAMIRAFHSVRFPIHDHCRKNLGWSNTQVLVRFVLLQIFLIPLLFAIFTKIR